MGDRRGYRWSRSGRSRLQFDQRRGRSAPKRKDRGGVGETIHRDGRPHQTSTGARRVLPAAYRIIPFGWGSTAREIEALTKSRVVLTRAQRSSV